DGIRCRTVTGVQTCALPILPQPITQESASHLRFLHESSSRFIDLFGRNSGTDKLADTIKNLTRGAARLTHLLDFFCAFDRNHARSEERRVGKLCCLRCVPLW